LMWRQHIFKTFFSRQFDKKERVSIVVDKYKTFSAAEPDPAQGLTTGWYRIQIHNSRTRSLSGF
jgi:hypothetical protein